MVDGVYEDAAGWITTGPKDGIAQLWFDSLPEGTKVGDTLEYLVEVTDASRIDAFELKLVLRVMPASNVTTSGTSGQSKTANKGAGSAGGSGTTLSLPDITLVHEADWGKHQGFDELSALKVVHAGTPGDVAAPVYDFFINVDNKFLRHSQKDQPSNADLLEKQFVYGFVLVGLALLQEHKQRGANEDGEDVEAYVLRTTRALASILVPMIQAVGGLAGDDV